ncbi:MAG: phosphoribosylanthranilate isomerase [Acidimicrobiales bacterium]
MFVKICGLTNEEDALMCAALGADAIGLVFAASSRRVSSGVARDIVRRLPPEILSVGVFRNESKERVVSIANKVGLRAVQLHGHETPDETQWVAARVPVVIRAFAAGDPAIARIDDYGDVRLMIDSAEPGSGKAFDWQRLRASRPRQEFWLAGGLHPDNVGRAISSLSPVGVDVSTGVEARPGIKDPVKVAHFITAARMPPPPSANDAIVIDSSEPSADTWDAQRTDSDPITDQATYSQSGPHGPYNWEDDA